MKNSESPAQAKNEQTNQNADAACVRKPVLSPAEIISRTLPDGAVHLAGIGYESPAFKEFSLSYRYEDSVYNVYCSLKKGGRP